MPNDKIDPVAAIRELFPSTGPHTPETVNAAAEAISELWRYLGHAFVFGSERIKTLDQVSDAYTLVGNLADADDRAATVLQRLKVWTDYVSARSMDGYGQVSTGRYAVAGVPNGTPDEVASMIEGAGWHLTESAALHHSSAEKLRSAHSSLSYLYTVNPDGDQDDDYEDED